MDDSKSSRLRLCIFLCVANLAFFASYWFSVVENDTYSYFQMPTLVCILGCIGLLYITHHPLERFENVVFNWLVIWLVCFEFYFLYLYLQEALKPYFGDFIIEVTNLPLLAITVAYLLNKPFLDLEYVVCFTIIGVMGFTGMQGAVRGFFNSFDAAGLTVFLYGGVYGTVTRLFMSAPFTLTQQLKLSVKKCIVGIIFALFFFPYIAIIADVMPSLAACNVMMCIVCGIIGCVIMHMAIDRKLEHQTVFFSAVAAGVALSPMPGIIQNLAAPAVVGTLIGIVATLFFNKPHSFLKTMPSFVAELFVIPSVLGGLLAMVFIGFYNGKTYNRIRNFPFPQYINSPGKYAGLELATVIVITLTAALAALVNMLICYLLRCRLKRDLLDPDFVMIEDSKFLLEPANNFNLHSQVSEDEIENRKREQERIRREAQRREDERVRSERAEEKRIRDIEKINSQLASNIEKANQYLAQPKRPTQDLADILPNYQVGKD